MATRGTSEAFTNVCDRELDIDDFYDVYDIMKPLSAQWKQIAISLRLRIDTINNIEAKPNGEIVHCLQKVLEVWLKKDYDYERHGVPCWRKVCVAVKEGGGNSALAEEIAEEHPATGGTTRSTASISNPSIYVPMTITDFELHRELFIIQEQFAESIQKTIKFYPEEWLPKLIDYITAHITNLLGPENTPAKAQAVRKEFKDITTIKDFFAILQDKYTSWFKHEPITKLVNDNNVDKDPDMDDDEYEVYMYAGGSSDPEYLESAPHYWSCYKSLLHEYFEKCITVADPASYGITDAPPGKQVIVAKVDRGDYNQNDLYFLRKAIPRELDKPDLKLYLCQVLPN